MSLSEAKKKLEGSRGTWRRVKSIEVAAIVGESRKIEALLECDHVVRGLVPRVAPAPRELPCRACLVGAMNSGTVCRKCRGIGRKLVWAFSRAFVEKCDACDGEGAVRKPFGE